MIHKDINNMIIYPTMNKVNNIILNQLSQIMNMNIKFFIFLFAIGLSRTYIML